MGYYPRFEVGALHIYGGTHGRTDVVHRGDTFVQENMALGAALPTIIKTLVEVYEDGTIKCPCHLWVQTGKYCGHLWALSWYFSSGSFSNHQGGFKIR